VIAIIDYGMGNLHSVAKAVERLGYAPAVTADPATILAADAAILPGVGAFGDAMRELAGSGLDRTVIEYAQSGRPLLGICLGMQLLFTESEEHGRHAGLNLLPGRVVRFRGDFKVPHMGWNRLYPVGTAGTAEGPTGANTGAAAGAPTGVPSGAAGAGEREGAAPNRAVHPLFAGVEHGCAYFVHSYHVLADRREDVLATTDYHGPVTAVVGRGNLFGMQFHPEKSGADGIRMLRNFLGLTQKPMRESSADPRQGE
jgi:glutamine amidotransferase